MNKRVSDNNGEGRGLISWLLKYSSLVTKKRIVHARVGRDVRVSIPTQEHTQIPCVYCVPYCYTYIRNIVVVLRC